MPRDPAGTRHTQCYMFLLAFKDVQLGRFQKLLIHTVPMLPDLQVIRILSLQAFVYLYHAHIFTMLLYYYS
jgi:hypothetical protein